MLAIQQGPEALAALASLRLYADASVPPFVAALVILAAVPVTIAVHEGAHACAARWAGLTVVEYSIGFGPVLVRWTWGGIPCAWRLAPVGGFVRIAGQGPVPVPDGATGWDDTAPARRAAVAAAGPGVHLVLAWLVITIALVAVGREVPTTRVASLLSWSPAHGVVEPGDVVVAIDGRGVDQYGELRAAMRAHRPGPVEVTVRRDGALRHVMVDAIADHGGGAVLGVVPVLAHDRTSIVSLPVDATRGLVHAVGRVASAAGALADPRGWTGRDPTAPRPVSPLGLASAAADAGRSGWGQLLGLLVTLQLFLALVNALPVPPLDGFHVAHALRRRHPSTEEQRRRDERAVRIATAVVVAALSTMSVTALVVDLVHLTR